VPVHPGWVQAVMRPPFLGSPGSRRLMDEVWRWVLSDSRAEWRRPPGPVALELDAGYLVRTERFLVVSCSAWFGFRPVSSSQSIAHLNPVALRIPFIACSESCRHNFKGWQCTSLGESRYPCSHHGIGCPLASVGLAMFYRTVMNREGMARSGHPSICCDSAVAAWSGFDH
jgi:hypothetical protein